MFQGNLLAADGGSRFHWDTGTLAPDCNGALNEILDKNFSSCVNRLLSHCTVLVYYTICTLVYDPSYLYIHFINIYFRQHNYVIKA